MNQHFHRIKKQIEPSPDPYGRVLSDPVNQFFRFMIFQMTVIQRSNFFDDGRLPGFRQPVQFFFFDQVNDRFAHIQIENDEENQKQRQKNGCAFLLSVENGKRCIHEGGRGQNLQRRKGTPDHLVHCSDHNPGAGDFPVEFYVIPKDIFFVFYFQRGSSSFFNQFFLAEIIIHINCFLISRNGSCLLHVFLTRAFW